jgi:hypothetical protein
MVGAARFELATPGPPERELLFFQCFAVPCSPSQSLFIKPSGENTAESLACLGLQFGLQTGHRNLVFEMVFV